MPLITFEYTANLPIDEKISSFLKETHETLVQIIRTDLTSCRSTITRHTHYVIADGDPNHAFILLSIRMLPGRSDEIKQLTGNTLLKSICQKFDEEIKKFKTQVRVYITEIDQTYYFGME